MNSHTAAVTDVVVGLILLTGIEPSPMHPGVSGYTNDIQKLVCFTYPNVTFTCNSLHKMHNKFLHCCWLSLYLISYCWQEQTRHAPGVDPTARYYISVAIYLKMQQKSLQAVHNKLSHSNISVSCFFIPFNQQELTAPACPSMYQHAPGVDQPVQQSTNINIIVPPPLHQFLLQVVDDCLILSTGIY